MESKNHSELCFPQLANLSCKKSMFESSEDVLNALLSLTCVLTVLLNLLVSVAISHFRQLHTPTNLLLLSLAVSDVLVGLLVWPGQIYIRTSCWAFGDIACVCYQFASYIVVSASVGNMVLISVDRYIAICSPLHYNVKVTVNTIQLCVCLCWLLLSLYCSVLLRDHLAHPEKCRSCYGECVVHLNVSDGIINMVAIFILPLSIIVTLYTRVFMVAVSQARAMRSHVTCNKVQNSVPLGAKKSELKAARTLGVLVLVFLVCFCPFYISSLVGDISFSTSAHYVVYLYNFNSCVNPLIYALFYPWFRRAVKHIVTLRILQPGSSGAKLV
ncbi:trace amine-associated receptor 13c-like [Corythoichthys intestinalis]|uniref:trace amine-associated receptor 13c-like n=1 Tax=Corythoichthys intestinalis TaxID=161448 RepID=UPI0025A57330|nr:trace amine-associated receptor 13c-like [Corythoichthys intestinalis]XP_061799432.1 trace amine-associated receptor 13c-like [Nerophis lumbriciformis]